MRKVLYIIMCSLVLMACGNRRKATNTVDEFLKANLVNAEYETEFISMDSTYKVKDSVLVALQQQAPQDKAFKKGIKWEKPVPRKIHLYADEGDTTGGYPRAHLLSGS